MYHRASPPVDLWGLAVAPERFRDQLGRTGALVHHRWWLRGEGSPGLGQQGYDYADIYTAIRSATGEDFTLVLPTVSGRSGFGSALLWPERLRLGPNR